VSLTNKDDGRGRQSALRHRVLAGVSEGINGQTTDSPNVQDQRAASLNPWRLSAARAFLRPHQSLPVPATVVTKVPSALEMRKCSPNV